MNQANPFLQTHNGERLYVIGDIHGQFRLLDIIFKQIIADLEGRPIHSHRIICLGDIIDRGESSREVIDYLMMRKDDTRLLTLRGNHEEMLLRGLNQIEDFAEWLRYGGVDTVLAP